MHQKELHFKSIEQGISYPQLTDQGMFPSMACIRLATHLSWVTEWQLFELAQITNWQISTKKCFQVFLMPGKSKRAQTSIFHHKIVKEQTVYIKGWDMNLKPKVRYTCLRKKIYLGPLFETVKSEKGICIPICL